jgi:hypothetical protein
MADAHKYQAHEVLNRVLNSGEDALNVDIDNVTLTTEGGDVAIDVALDKANDSVTIYANTAADGSGTNTVPLVDAAGNLQIDIVSSALPSGGATAANQSTIIGHVDGIETLITSTNSKIDTLDAVQDSALTKLGEIETTNNANQVLLGTIDSDTDAIKTAVQILDNAISGTEMQVDVVAALPAGSNAIGKLAANSGVDIGDVDVTSLPASTNTIEIVGDAAEDANAAGNPVLVGGRYDAPGNDNSSLRSLDDTDVGALALDPTGAAYVREHLGQSGSCFVSGTAAVTAAYGKFVAIQFLEDTVFNGTNGLVATDTGRWPDDSAAASDVSSSNTAAVGSQSFPQGMTIFGRWDSFILVSGAVIAYVGNV